MGKEGEERGWILGLAHGEVMTRGELFSFIILLLSFGLLASFMRKCCLFLDVEKPCRSDLDLISNHHDNWEHETVSDLSFPFCYKITPHHCHWIFMRLAIQWQWWGETWRFNDSDEDWFCSEKDPSFLPYEHVWVLIDPFSKCHAHRNSTRWVLVVHKWYWAQLVLILDFWVSHSCLGLFT